MNHEQYISNEPQGIADSVESKVAGVKAKALSAFDAYEEKVRASPEKAILIATAAGYCLHILPVRVLVGAPIRLALLLAKPAIFALGASKVCEIIQSKARK